MYYSALLFFILFSSFNIQRLFSLSGFLACIALLFSSSFSPQELSFGSNSGFGKGTGKELWVDRYKPCTFEDLAVHKRKVK